RTTKRRLLRRTHATPWVYERQRLRRRGAKVERWRKTKAPSEGALLSGAICNLVVAHDSLRESLAEFEFHFCSARALLPCEVGVLCGGDSRSRSSRHHFEAKPRADREADTPAEHA